MRMPAASATNQHSLLRSIYCLPTALGCQLIEAATSVRRRFWGSSKASNALDRLKTLRFVWVIVDQYVEYRT
jgi:hypothetical protein